MKIFLYLSRLYCIPVLIKKLRYPKGQVLPYLNKRVWVSSPGEAEQHTHARADVAVAVHKIETHDIECDFFCKQKPHT